ncbi:MAG: Ig-like domain-containing protein [Verrucomicrobia bacterium]|nr:Ig-like domain-containing protein [Verrucomicrobiota bacterium]
MKQAVLAVLVLTALLGVRGAEAAVATAWFTDAEVEGASRGKRPAVAVHEAPGAVGKGVWLDQPVAIDNPLLRGGQGYISFWIRPNWNGNDGKAHRLLRIGDGRNGLLVEKSAQNVLRFIMASPGTTTASRADVSHWRAGEWHHVVVVWMEFDGKPMGLPLWIDRVAVAGPIAGGTTFIDPGALDDKRIWLGDSMADAVIDELVLRNDIGPGHTDVVYRDYFRTAPYSAIRIDPEPHRVAADRRVVQGHEKQFGLEGWLVNRAEKMTDFTARYGCWGDFDAKPLIKWSTSDSKVATVDENGLVTGKTVGRCTLTAEFRDLTATYELEVIPIEQPDLCLAYVERLPRYLDEGDKKGPAVGDRVKAVAHVYNMGFRPSPAGVPVLFELFADRNRNYRIDPGEPLLAQRQTARLGALQPGGQATLTFEWRWPSEPAWVCVTVDAQGALRELCEANNQRWFLTTARPMWWGYIVEEMERFHRERTINFVGSFSTFDWAQAHAQRTELMMRDAVYPSTSPDGVRDSIYLDIIAPKPEIFAGDGDFRDVPQKPELNRSFWDGGWPNHEINHPLMYDSGVLHELGHTMLALPDLYGYPVCEHRVYLKDERGAFYAGGPLMPFITSWKCLPRTRAAGFVPCNEGYSSLMDACHLWLDESNAAKIQHFAGFRGQRFWGVQGKFVPKQNALVVLDVNDRPLPGAAVYVYHVTQNPIRDGGAKYFHDRAKFVGNTDVAGRFVFPSRTDGAWDDAETDTFDGAIAVSNPFGGAERDTAGTPSVWSVDGLLLVRIVSGVQTEFYWLDLTEFNIACFRNRDVGVYPIRTSLPPSAQPTPIVRPAIPEAIRRENLKPVAVVETTELTVRVGETFTLDGSRSHDPEGQPFVHAEWRLREGEAEPHEVTGLVYTGKATGAGELEYVFYVNDGLRVSEAVWVKVQVKE